MGSPSEMQSRRSSHTNAQNAATHTTIDSAIVFISFAADRFDVNDLPKAAKPVSQTKVYATLSMTGSVRSVARSIT